MQRGPKHRRFRCSNSHNLTIRYNTMKDQNPSSFLAGAFSGKHGERGMPQQEKQTQTLQSPAAGPTRIFLRLLALPLAAMATFACSLDGLDEAERSEEHTSELQSS